MSDRHQDDGREAMPPELREALESAESDHESDAESWDEELDTDARSDRFGWYAGVAVAAVLGIMLFVGPWRWFNVAPTGGIPFSHREAAQGILIFIAPVVVAVVGAGTGFLYRTSTPDRPAEYRAGITVRIVTVQIIVTVLIFLAMASIAAGREVLAGDYTIAVMIFGGSIVYLLLFTFFEYIGALIYVGIPSYVGVYLGTLLGAIAERTRPT